jgi:hypothetical protein
MSLAKCPSGGRRSPRSDRVLEGDLEPLIHAYLVFRKTGKLAGEGELPE